MGDTSISMMIAILYFRMGPVTGCPPYVLAPPIPPWGIPSAAGVAGEHPMPPILFLRKLSISQGVRRRFLSIRSPWWRVGGSWQGWMGTDAFIRYQGNEDASVMKIGSVTRLF